MQPGLQIPSAPILVTNADLVADVVLLAGGRPANLTGSAIKARIILQDGSRELTTWETQAAPELPSSGEIEIRIPAAKTALVTEGPVLLEIHETTAGESPRILLRSTTLSVRRSPA